MADQETVENPSGESTAPEKQPETVPIKHAESLPLETTPTTAPENEPDKKANPAPETGLREKIRRATSGLFVGFKKGRGRPKDCRACNGEGCGECNWTGKIPGKADVVERSAANPPGREPDFSSGQIPVAPLGGAVPDSGRASLFRRSVVAAARSVIKILTGIVKVYCDAAEIDQAFSKQALARCQPDDDTLSRFTDNLDAVLKKHNVEPKHAEEIALVVSGLEIVAPFGVLIAELKGEIRRKRELERAK